MLTLLTCIAAMGLFWAGAFFTAHTTAAVVLLSVCAIVMGLLFAAAETRGYEGQKATERSAYTIADLLGDVADRAALYSTPTHTVSSMIDHRPLYLMTQAGLRPVRSLTFCRINSQPAILLDTTDDNADTQGVRY